MHVELQSDGHYPKRALHRCVLAARDAVLEYASLPPVFRVIIETQPRRKRIKGSWCFGVLRLRVGQKDLSYQNLSRHLAWSLYYHTHPHAGKERWNLVYQGVHEAYGKLPSGAIEPVPKKPKAPKRLPPDARYEKCLAQIGQAQAKLVTLQKQVARAEAHLAKKNQEARKLERALTKPLKAGDRLSDTQLAARLAFMRKHGPAEPTG